MAIAFLTGGIYIGFLVGVVVGGFLGALVAFAVT